MTHLAATRNLTLAPIYISRTKVLSPLECATFCHLEGLARCQGYVYDKAAQNCTLAPIYYLHDPESPDPGIVAMVRHGLPMAGTVFQPFIYRRKR